MEDSIPSVEDNQRAGEEIARLGGPKAAGLLVAVMDANARSAERLDAQLREMAERDLERWKTRALRAEAQLERVRNRFLSILELGDVVWVEDEFRSSDH